MTPFIPTYRRTGSPLHAARPSVAVFFVAGPCFVALVFDHPLVLLGVLAGTVAAGLAARLGPELARAALIAAPLALLVVLANPLASQQGLTVLVSGPVVPVLGRVDVTLEALVYGCIAGLRVMIVALAFALYSAAVNPDDILRLIRRLSVRSALTASLATRLVPLLGRDAERLGEAYSLRAADPIAGGRRRRARRAAILTRALAANALERAVDLAAALEVRGYAGAPRRSSARTRVPWSRHDTAFAIAGFSVVLVAASALALGVARFTPYPSIELAHGAASVGLPLVIVGAMVAPFIASSHAARRLQRKDRSAARGGRGARAGAAHA